MSQVLTVLTVCVHHVFLLVTHAYLLCEELAKRVIKKQARKKVTGTVALPASMHDHG